MAVEEPRPRVVRPEPDRDVVACRRRARRDDIAPDRVVVVVRGRAGGADDREGVLGRRVRGGVVAKGIRCLRRGDGTGAGRQGR